jgi:hypothetical protein
MKEVHEEPLKINGYWTDFIERGEDMSWRIQHTPLWINDRNHDEGIFMPSTKANKAALLKGKEVASSKAKGGSCKGKGHATSKIDDDDDDFMPSTEAKKAASTKGKRVA